MSKKRTKAKGPGYLCRKCGAVMKKRDLICKQCRHTQPAAVKAHLASLRKALGGRVEPVAAPASRTVVKAAAPRTAEQSRREALIKDLYASDPVTRNAAHYAAHPNIRPPWGQS